MSLLINNNINLNKNYFTILEESGELVRPLLLAIPYESLSLTNSTYEIEEIISDGIHASAIGKATTQGTQYNFTSSKKTS